MRKKIEPRFPESLKKLQAAVRAYGNNTKLSKLTGISTQTLSKIADGTTRFPWAQTVEALWNVLNEPVTVMSESTQDEKRHVFRQDVRSSRRYGYDRNGARARRFQVRVGSSF